ncbi:hypothetical protein BCR44DRAFT_43155 [Catenaria anguillulae PL171]|uniref:Uncharacterized protein n=1 Tax=Catenaria anguillulae PL171 TaxID=765915 RepID=A0A1Y2H831_9FUNG|nr:hypothetical protein BCR44DRAFT_43155 [Catenaria anguillulae PL171]
MSSFKQDVMDVASRKNQVHVLDWWLTESGVDPLPHTKQAFHFAVCECSLDAADWWRNDQPQLKVNDYRYYGCWPSKAACVWALHHGLCKHVSDASGCQSPIVFEMMKRRAGISADGGAADYLSPTGAWCARQPSFEIDIFLTYDNALDDAVHSTVFPVLEWWESSGYPGALSSDALDGIDELDEAHPVRQWFERIKGRLETPQ